MQRHIRKVYACLIVTCHLHFWQNDRDMLRAAAVTRGWNGYQNKSQHRKLTLEKKILQPLLPGFEPATFQSRVRRSNHWAIPPPQMSFVVNRRVSWITLTVLFESQPSFVPLLSFSLWSKQESHLLSFSHGILVEAFWLAEASRKLLLLAWDISLSKMCVKKCVCVRFLALSFKHNVSLMLPSVPRTPRKQLA